ncbi:subunit 7 of oligomeric Golgi complex [Chloropicon primus]|uniref:Conserved oligomeric Golgi complex subunit 7 n=1 Tax=Chloropicon primus TaxID=1764295 RepID=A0A5B8MLJ5_9CHLO|nr:subunit 7 of oligomeric Golgi complex [Chloropicon primus]UPR00511.1 subunit 7 of oligomeric Golgi complex [Chloropicon primus]|eukprot:QDZ21297.1 subunit 7 of oligomeric Golgi complex [Chloropicon primus]
MTVTDLFDGGQDAPSWLNERLSGIEGGNEDDLLEALGELEVKLQLKADDVEASMEGVAKDAHEEIPLARAELSELRQRAGGVANRLHSCQSLLSNVDGVADGVLVMDRVQTNMRMARDKLSEAAGMAQLLATVDQTFKQGNLTTIGRQLKQISEGLESVSGVPEFAGVETKLHEFEERLQQMVEAPLQKAFEDHDAQAVKHLSSILSLGSKDDAIGTLFVSAKISQLQSSWETFGGLGVGKNAVAGEVGSGKVVTFEDWLPEWLRNVLTVVESEHKWCLEILPEQADNLFMTLVETCFIGIKQSFKNRLQNTLSATKLAYDAGDSSVSPLQVLLKVKSGLKEFLTSVSYVLNRRFDDSQQKKGKLLECLALCTYGQIKDQVLLYPLLERQEITGLHNKLAGDLMLPTAKLKQATHSQSASIADSIEACTNAVHSIIGPSCEVGASSVERCMSITDGFKIDELLLVVDECLAAFLSKICLTLRVIKDCVTSVKGSMEGQEGSEVSYDYSQQALPQDLLVAILRVLQIAALFSNSVGNLEESLRTSVASLRSRMESGSFEGIHIWFTLFPGQKEEHQSKLARLEAPLPSAKKAMKDFASSAEDLVLDFMMVKVKESLQGIKESKLWSRTEEKDKTFDLPSFSVFPSKHVTSLGEYLLVIPQQFEVLDDLEELSPTGSEAKERREGDQASEPSSFAAEWISKIVEEASKLYTRDILRIPRLSENGCSQLQADIDYLGNILQALFVSAPVALSTIAANLSLSAEEVKDPSSSRPKDCDGMAWDTVVKMRGGGG